MILIFILLGVLAMPSVFADSPETTRKNGEKILESCMKRIERERVLNDKENVYTLGTVKNVHMISRLTGEYSENRTKSRYGVGGTDLGVIISKGDTQYFAFGDTFLQENQTENWRNNVIAYTKDTDYTDGIIFDGMLPDKAGNAAEILAGLRQNNGEWSKIPTGGIAIGDTIYLSYMSVREWLPQDGAWDCNYGGVAKSGDDGKTWQYLTELRWENGTGFNQLYPVMNEKDGYIYVVGIPGGRYGGAKMMRVPAGDYERKSEYEYYTGMDASGAPVFVKGSEGLAHANYILWPSVGETSLMYSEYLDEWIITYLCGSVMVMRVANDPWGPYSSPLILLSREHYPLAYGAFMNEQYVSDGGRKVAFIMSLYSPVYNTVVMEMELVRKDEMN